LRQISNSYSIILALEFRRHNQLNMLLQIRIITTNQNSERELGYMVQFQKNYGERYYLLRRCGRQTLAVDRVIGNYDLPDYDCGGPAGSTAGEEQIVARGGAGDLAARGEVGASLRRTICRLTRPSLGWAWAQSIDGNQPYVSEQSPGRPAGSKTKGKGKAQLQTQAHFKTLNCSKIFQDV
jgi:hypothetical protein